MAGQENGGPQEGLLEDRLRTEGVSCRGFGVIPRHVMADTGLTVEAKAIYAYFCSFAGNGSGAFPGRSRILADLSMSKDAYYRHFRLLTGRGYILAEQGSAGGLKGRNLYTLLSGPEAGCGRQDGGQGGGRIRFSGLKADGYGIVPKAAMLDARLSVKAKGLYAYFCSLTGSGRSAFPRKDRILFHLGITEPTYYRAYRQLVGLNYLTAVQRHVGGKLAVNDYYLSDAPDRAKASRKAVSVAGPGGSPDRPGGQGGPGRGAAGEGAGGQAAAGEGAGCRDAGSQDTRKQDTVKQDTNNNNKNSINKNKNSSSLPPSFPHPPPERMREGKDEESVRQEVERELAAGGKVPSRYLKDRRRMEEAVRSMAGWAALHRGYRDGLEQRVYRLFVEALLEMCLAGEMTLKGCGVTSAAVLERLNRLAVFEDGYVDLSEFSAPAMQNFERAVVEREVRSPVRYMMSCIWDAMQAGAVSLYADLRRLEGGRGQDVRAPGS